MALACPPFGQQKSPSCSQKSEARQAFAMKKAVEKH